MVSNFEEYVICKSILRTHLAFLGLVLTSTITAQAAEPQCTLRSTIAECQERIVQDQKILKQLNVARMPTFLDIAKNADGSVKYMSHADATQYCSNQGAHLPSARELSQLSMSLGARGIVDSCSSYNKCQYVGARNADGSSDRFYFSYAGYQLPAADIRKDLFWSSGYLGNSDYAFILDGNDGDIVYGNIEYVRIAVRCVSNR